MTWLEVKTAALQKMFAGEGSSTDYLAAMPAAANEGLALLWSSGFGVRRSAATEGAAGANTLELSTLAPDWDGVSGPELCRETAGGPAPVRGVRLFEGRLSFTGPAGAYLLYYAAAPARLDGTTPDEFELPVPAAAAALLPLYIASELYKDDDPMLATLYRNEFDAARAELPKPVSGLLSDDFVSESGWV